MVTINTVNNRRATQSSCNTSYHSAHDFASIAIEYDDAKVERVHNAALTLQLVHNMESNELSFN